MYKSLSNVEHARMAQLTSFQPAPTAHCGQQPSCDRSGVTAAPRCSAGTSSDRHRTLWDSKGLTAHPQGSRSRRHEARAARVSPRTQHLPVAPTGRQVLYLQNDANL